MPRKARRRSPSGIYHVIMRGINRQIIFLDQEDRLRFIRTLEKYQPISTYLVFAYCLMGNHVHILLKEGKEPMATVMRRICGSYVLWYNQKYTRVGHLFQGRYKSEPVNDDRYFLTVLRYIFQNPVKAGLVEAVGDYRWTNYFDYFKASSDEDLAFVLSFFDDNPSIAKDLLAKYLDKNNDDACLDIQERQHVNDRGAEEIIREFCGAAGVPTFKSLTVPERDSVLRSLKARGISVRQLERLTGINRGVIQRA